MPVALPPLPPPNSDPSEDNLIPEMQDPIMADGITGKEDQP